MIYPIVLICYPGGPFDMDIFPVACPRAQSLGAGAI